MIRIFFVIILLTLGLEGHSQQAKADSLLKILKSKKPDSSYVKICLQIGDVFENSNPDSALIWYQKAYITSENEALKYNDNRELAAGYYALQSKALRYISVIYYNQGKFDKCLEYDTKALHFVEKSNDLKEYAFAFRAVGNDYMALNDLEKAVLYLNQSLQNFIKIKNKSGIAENYFSLGDLNIKKEDFTIALDYFSKAQRLYQELNNQNRISEIYNNQGIVYRKLGNYQKSIDCYQKAMTIKEKMGNKTGMGFTLINMGNVYLDWKNYKKSLEYFDNALQILKETKQMAAIAACYSNMAMIFEEMKNLEKALAYNEKSLKIDEEIGNRSGVASSLNNIGELYQNLKDYDKALQYHMKALEIKRVLDNKFAIISSLNNIGIVYLKKKNFIAAVDYINQSLELSKAIGANREELEIYHSFYKIYQEMGDFKNAFNYQEKYLLLKDSLFNENSQKQISGFQVKYEFEKKEKVNQLLSKQAELQKLELNKNRILIYSMLGGFILLILIIILVLRSNRIKQKINYVLLLKNVEIEKQKWEITDQASRLEQTNIELEKLSIVASKTDNGVTIYSRNWTIEFRNMAFNKLYGEKLNEKLLVKGQNIRDLKDDRIIGYFQQCTDSKKTIEYELQKITISGEKMWVHTTVTPIMDESGELYKLIAIDTDISRIKNAEEEVINKGEMLHEMNVELKKRNLQITDSIGYAKLIQDAILPTVKQFELLFSDYFIYYKSKAIVSGDLYWLCEKNNYIFIAMVDCTGHGVPGALMSMIGNTLLNEIILERNIFSPAMVLDQLNEKVLFALNQGGEDLETLGDGMDISLYRIDKKNKELLFAGARQPSYLILNNKMNCINGDSFSIGGLLVRKFKNKFTEYSAPLDENTIIYLLTDGYIDQFGGPDTDKFGVEQFKNIIMKSSHLKMKDQKNIFEAELLQWMGNHQQTDDIALIGIKI